MNIPLLAEGIDVRGADSFLGTAGFGQAEIVSRGEDDVRIPGGIGGGDTIAAATRMVEMMLMPTS